MKTVNFIEAVNSGKRFRPIGKWNGGWHSCDCGDNGRVKQQTGGTVLLGRKFYNAQFELEEKSITITEGEFDRQYKRCISCHQGMVSIATRNDFKKELGF